MVRYSGETKNDVYPATVFALYWWNRLSDLKWVAAEVSIAFVTRDVPNFFCGREWTTEMDRWNQVSDGYLSSRSLPSSSPFPVRVHAYQGATLADVRRDHDGASKPNLLPCGIVSNISRIPEDLTNINERHKENTSQKQRDPIHGARLTRCKWLESYFNVYLRWVLFSLAEESCFKASIYSATTTTGIKWMQTSH